jgi:hypothetical protein
MISEGKDLCYVVSNSVILYDTYIKWVTGRDHIVCIETDGIFIVELILNRSLQLHNLPCVS